MWTLLRRFPFAVLLAIVFSLMIAARLKMMWDISSLLDCNGCLVYPSLVSEAQLFLGLVCADLAARRWLGRGAWLVRLLVLGCLLIWVLDFWVRETFQVRLDWRELKKFRQDLGSAGFFLRIFIKNGVGYLVAGLLATACILWMAVGYLRQQQLRHPVWLLPVAGLSLALSLFSATERHYHHMHVRNPLVAFFDPPSIHKEYSAAWVDQQLPRLREAAGAKMCSKQGVPAASPRQVVLIIVESLSSYQSQAFGGIHDWTPQLDRWMRKGRSFTHFLANGKTTEDGLFALLTGRPPILQSGRQTVFESDLDPARPTLPDLVRQSGFTAAFMTTGNLEFMQKKAWLDRIGFQMISGHDDAFYDGMQRYHFDAPADAALYDNAWQWMRTQEQPYLLVLETVSTHQPFFDPVQRKPSMEGAFRYADAVMGDFLSHLESTGFFERGLVIVTGDHRAMVAPVMQERERMGEDHLSRIPMLLLGQSAQPGQDSGYFSQQDLLPSLGQMLDGGEACRYPGQSLWNQGQDKARAECVFVVKAQQPDSIFLQCGGSMLEVNLDAENTHYVGKRGPERYLDAIHIQRTGVHQPVRQTAP